MPLQIKRTGSADYGYYVKILVCGEPGSGKTLTASTWPNVLYANAEGGLMSVASQNIPAVDIVDSSTLLELKNELAQSSAVREKVLGVPVDTVVIDTIDEVARILMKERIESSNKDAMAIADWGWLGEQLRTMVRAYRNLPMNVIFTCHLKSVEDADTGTQFFKPAIQGAMGDEIAGYVDIATVLTARPITEIIDGKNHRRLVRIMQTFPDVKRPWIKDRSGKLPMEFPINFEDDYKRLNELIYGDIIDSQPLTQETIIQPLVSDIKDGDIKDEVAAPKKRTRTKKEEVGQQPVEAPDVVQTPEPLVEPPAPAAPVTPEPEPEPEVASEPEIATPVEAAVQSEVPVDSGTKEAWEICAECGGPIESKDQADLSFIRFRKSLCRADFAAARKR